MPQITYGDFDVLLIRLDPVTMDEIWVTHMGGSITDLAIASVVSPVDGSIFMLVDSNSPEWTNYQELLILSFDFESKN